MAKERKPVANIPEQVWIISHDTERCLTQWCGLSPDAAWNFATGADDDMRDRMEAEGYRAVRYVKVDP